MDILVLLIPLAWVLALVFLFVRRPDLATWQFWMWVIILGATFIVAFLKGARDISLDDELASLVGLGVVTGSPSLYLWFVQQRLFVDSKRRDNLKDKIAPNGTIDVYALQLVIFMLVLSAAYVISATINYAALPVVDSLKAIPGLTPGMVWLAGLSQFAYLGQRAILSGPAPGESLQVIPGIDSALFDAMVKRGIRTTGDLLLAARDPERRDVLIKLIEKGAWGKIASEVTGVELDFSDLENKSFEEIIKQVMRNIGLNEEDTSRLYSDLIVTLNQKRTDFVQAIGPAMAEMGVPLEQVEKLFTDIVNLNKKANELKNTLAAYLPPNADGTPQDAEAALKRFVGALGGELGSTIGVLFDASEWLERLLKMGDLLRVVGTVDSAEVLRANGIDSLRELQARYQNLPAGDELNISGASKALGRAVIPPDAVQMAEWSLAAQARRALAE